jgi:aspartate 1-decarboxylase|tara:strand:+ start:223 stop:669 length:447 start_codon:yes stop_codon:yes gene_type:complete
MSFSPVNPGLWKLTSDSKQQNKEKNMRNVLRGKIHRAWVTDANPDYVGSILIDQDLMDKIDLWNFEKVLICDVTNGNRFETYAIAGERGSGVCSVQGAAARLSAKGNCLIIMSFDVTDEPIDPQMILVDEENKFVEFLEGAKNVQQVH